MLALGAERYLSLPAAVNAEWAQRAEAALSSTLPRLRERWLEAERRAYLESPPFVWEQFQLSQVRRPLTPRPFATSFASALQVAPSEAVQSQLDEAAVAEALGTPAALGRALDVYRNLAGEGPLPETAALAAGATASKLGQFDEAARYYQDLVGRRSYSAPWVRAFAWSRLVETLLRAGKRPEAKAQFEAFAVKLLDRESRELAGLSAERRFFLARRARRTLGSLDSAAGARLARLLQVRAAEESLLDSLQAQITPWLAGMKLPARSEFNIAGRQTLIAARPRKGGGVEGALLDPVAFRSEVLARLEATPEFEFVLPSGSEAPGEPLARGELFATPGSPRILVLAASPEARAAELHTRRRNLLAIMFFVGGGLLLGNVFVLTRLRREMRVSQLKSDLLANVSHDLRTPLAIIRSAAETLQLNRFEGQPKKAERYLWVIVEETIRLDALVANVLDAARIELGRKEYSFAPLSPQELVQDLERRWRPYLERAGFELVVKCAEAPVIRADSACLRTALSNLIENSMKYSEEVKRIEISVGPQDEGVEFSVADRGRGVDERELTRIFERHYRAPASALSTQGLGLGLALVVETARAHGGSVHCEAEAEGGSRFALRLPIGDVEGDAELIP
ncbi:MAG: HAMP domain-containing histidine kinase [Planctomycetes bacterium]|nr:HAMP domain-containing histidine kinase [Planctomycetota bacterium]